MRKLPKDNKPLPLLEWLDAHTKGDEKWTRRTRFWSRVSGVCVGALLLTSILPQRPLFVWNASPSATIGLYVVGSNTQIKRGDMVALWLPPAPRKLASDRHYLPYNIPAIKRVVAVENDGVCAEGSRVSVNNVWMADRLVQDGKGRPMPWWQGCYRLSKTQVFFINEEAANSFDGRYIGISNTSDVIGKATLLWVG